MSGEQKNCHCLCRLPEDPGTRAEVLSGIFVCVWGHFFPPQRAQGCTWKQPPVQSSCKTRLLLCAQLLLGGHEQPHFSLRLRFCHLPLALILSATASHPRKRERKRWGGHKGHLQGTTRQPCEHAPAWAKPSFRPMPGQPPVIHFHWQSLYMSSAALPPGMVCPVLSLREKMWQKALDFNIKASWLSLLWNF